MGRPSINEFLSSKKDWKLSDEGYWDGGPSATVYYMIGAWATAYLIHSQGIKEETVLRDWYCDIPRMGKAAAFQKHMGLSLADFYTKFDSFIRQPDADAMKIFKNSERQQVERGAVPKSGAKRGQ